jgi:hypothetical protein
MLKARTCPIKLYLYIKARIKRACNNTNKDYYEVEPLGACSICWKRQVMVVCAQYAIPYEWNIWIKHPTMLF